MKTTYLITHRLASKSLLMKNSKSGTIMNLEMHFQISTIPCLIRWKKILSVSLTQLWVYQHLHWCCCRLVQTAINQMKRIQFQWKHQILNMWMHRAKKMLNQTLNLLNHLVTLLKKKQMNHLSILLLFCQLFQLAEAAVHNHQLNIMFLTVSVIYNMTHWRKFQRWMLLQQSHQFLNHINIWWRSSLC